MSTMVTTVWLWLSSIPERILLAFVSWALKHDSVQEILIEKLTNDHRLTQNVAYIVSAEVKSIAEEAAADAAEECVSGLTLYADNVEGLEQLVSSMIEETLAGNADWQIDASMINGLDEVIEEEIEKALEEDPQLTNFTNLIAQRLSY